MSEIDSLVRVAVSRAVSESRLGETPDAGSRSRDLQLERQDEIYRDSSAECGSPPLTFSTSLKKRTRRDTRTRRMRLRIRTNMRILIILLVLEGLSWLWYCRS